MNQTQWIQRFENKEIYSLSPESTVSLNKSIFEDGVVGYLGASFLIQTSGSSGSPKWVVHSKEKLLRHACLVNAHLNITHDDVLGLMLPTHHVGGLGVIARAIVSGASLAQFKGKWSVSRGIVFLEEHKISVVSMVPTQIVDVVRGGYSCPSSIRLVIVGGGMLDPEVKNKAITLGWLIYESYGMTETGSQIATGLLGDGKYLRLINGWQVRVNNEAVLEIKGDCLFHGYLENNKNQYTFVDPKIDGWFKTNDRVELKVVSGGVGIKFLSRGDQLVKVLGELVDLSSLESRLRKELGDEVYVVPLYDERRGVKLMPVTTSKYLAKKVNGLKWRGLERLARAVIVYEFPRNEMGKLKRSKLEEMVESIVFPAD